MRTITEALSSVVKAQGQWIPIPGTTVESIQGVERFLGNMLHRQEDHFEATKDDLLFGAQRLRALADLLEKAAG